MECKYCGKALKIGFREKLFCDDKCKTKYKYLQSKLKVKKCIQCGKVLEGRQKKFCSDDCVGQYKQERALERYEANKKPKAEAKPKKKKPKMSIAQINELARAEGLNYGQYCAKYNL